MLESTVVHHSRNGGGGDGDIVGISWKAPTRSHPSPSLVVTCAHQVVVYKPGEARRIHQWSFKPSAATVLSHPTVFLPAMSRYVGVQQGSIIVSWQESEQSVKRPLSTQAASAVQAVHACPLLGDYFVVVLSSGGVVLYQGGLKRVVHTSDAFEDADDGASGSVNAKPKSETKKKSKVVWSGVLGVKLAVLAKVGAAERLTTFALSLDSSPRRASAANASVMLVSSHILPKPPRPTGPRKPPATEVLEEASAHSAAFLGGGHSRSCEGSVMAVAWRTSYGPTWTKIVVGASGIRDEFARSAMNSTTGDGAFLAAPNGTTDDALASTPRAALTNGHRNSRRAKGKKSTPPECSGIAGESVSTGSIPVLAAADGGRLLIHSGGACPRLAVWDATYGVLLENERAPEAAEGDAKRVASLLVSGDGAHLALAVAGRVLVCPVPVRVAGTLSSLLKRRRPSFANATSTSRLERSFPSIDLARSDSAADLLESTGAIEPDVWDAGVVTPFRDAEARIVRSLEDAARRNSVKLFERVVWQHVQRRETDAAKLTGDSVGDEGGKMGQDERRKRRRVAEGSMARVVTAAAVELCLANPEAALWSALVVLLRSGGVSARQHKGLVGGVIKYAPQLLEEVMVHVPDLPEAGAVRILGHVLSEASVMASSGGNMPSSITSEVFGFKSSGGQPPQRARGQNHGDGNEINSISSQDNDYLGVSTKTTTAIESVVELSGGSKDDAASVLKSGSHARRKKKKKKDFEAETVKKRGPTDPEPGVDEPTKGFNGAVAIASLSNGCASSMGRQDDDGCAGGGSVGDGTVDVQAGSGAMRTADGSEIGSQSAGKSAWREATCSSVKTACSPRTAVALVERAVRVAVSLPHNEVFLRSALAGWGHREIIIVLKMLTRLLSESLSDEPEGGCGGDPANKSEGFRPVGVDAIVGWASALLDSHFTRLAIGGAADAELVGALEALKKTTRKEAECCELLSEVRSLVNEVARRRAAVEAEEARRHSKDVFSLRVLRF